MNKTAKDYPVKYPYGYSKAYGGWHTGEDRPAPSGTPVVVNGVQIGLVGSTGYSTGPHLHIGKYSGGVSHNPNGQGFTFKSAKVTEVAEDGRNGKFVRVQGDGYSWVYLHLSKQTCKVGQVLKVKAPVAIPLVRKFYTVRKGDTVDRISKIHKLSTKNNYAAFRKLNPNIKNVNWIYVGQRVRVK